MLLAAWIHTAIVSIMSEFLTWDMRIQSADILLRMIYIVVAGARVTQTKHRYYAEILLQMGIGNDRD